MNKTSKSTTDLEIVRLFLSSLSKGERERVTNFFLHMHESNMSEKLVLDLKNKKESRYAKTTSK